MRQLGELRLGIFVSREMRYVNREIRDLERICNKCCISEFSAGYINKKGPSAVHYPRLAEGPCRKFHSPSPVSWWPRRLSRMFALKSAVQIQGASPNKRNPLSSGPRGDSMRTGRFNCKDHLKTSQALSPSRMPVAVLRIPSGRHSCAGGKEGSWILNKCLPGMII